MVPCLPVLISTGLELILLLCLGALIFYVVLRGRQVKRIESSLIQKLAYFEAFFEGSDSSICILDRESRILKWNRHFANGIEAYSDVDIKKGMHVEDYLDSELFDQNTQWRENLEKALNGESHSTEIHLQRKDGSSIWFETRWIPVEIEGNNFAVAVVSTDITKRKEYEESLVLAERRFSAFIKNCTEAICCVDLVPPLPPGLSVDEQLDYIAEHSIIAEVNEAMVNTSKFSSIEEAIGQPLSEIIPPSDDKNIENYRKVVASNFRMRDFKTYEVDENGNVHIYLNNIIGDYEDGYLVRAWATGRDISDLEATMNKLRAAEAKYRSVVELANEAILITQEQKVQYCNPAALGLTGYSEEEIRNRSFIEFIHPNDRELVLNEYRQRISGEKTRNRYTIRILTKSGETKTVIVNSATAEWMAKPAILTLLSDISELMELQDQLTEQKEHLARMERITIFGHLTGAIAHELNQPLTGILSNAQAAELLHRTGKSTPEEVQQVIREIIEDTKRAGNIIRNLRDLYGEQKGASMPTDLNQVIEQTHVILKNEFINNHVCFLLEGEDDLPMVDGNPAQIQQVILNLIINAVDALRANKEDNRLIKISTISEASIIRVTVTDNGPGIDPNKLVNIFQPLSSWKSGGMGLGLAISDSIIDNHGGRMFASNMQEGGASVGFEIPILNNVE